MKISLLLELKVSRSCLPPPLIQTQPERLISLVTANQAATVFHNVPLYETNKPQNSMETARAAPASCFVIPVSLKEEISPRFLEQSIFISQGIPG